MRLLGHCQDSFKSRVVRYGAFALKESGHSCRIPSTGGEPWRDSVADEVQVDRPARAYRRIVRVGVLALAFYLLLGNGLILGASAWASWRERPGGADRVLDPEPHRRR